MTEKSAKPIIIVIDGIIGCGKTTMIDECLVPILTSRGYRITVIPEPVEKWKASGILQRFYSDPKRWGYHFQTKAFVDRVNMSIEKYNEYIDVTDVFILERSIFTDNLFMEMLHESKTIDDLEMADYREWWAMWGKVMPFEPDVFVYLRPSLDECMRRVNERDRIGELQGSDDTKGVTAEYQQCLLDKHDKFLGGDYVYIHLISGRDEIPVVRLETDDNFRDDYSIKEKICDKFERIISNIRSK